MTNETEHPGAIPMSAPIPVLNMRQVRGGLPGGAVYVGRGRGSRWGNPFTVGKYGRDDAIQRYREHISQLPGLVDELIDERPTALVCWCAPLPCHGDVLAELLAARGYEPPEQVGAP